MVEIATTKFVHTPTIFHTAILKTANKRAVIKKEIFKILSLFLNLKTAKLYCAFAIMGSRPINFKLLQTRPITMPKITKVHSKNLDFMPFITVKLRIMQITFCTEALYPFKRKDPMP